MFSACCSNNKILQTSRKSHRGTIHCPGISRMFPFTAVRLSDQRFWCEWMHRCHWCTWVMSSISTTCSNVYGWGTGNERNKLNDRCSERAKDNHMPGSSNHKIFYFLFCLVFCFEYLIRGGLWEISCRILCSSLMSWKTQVIPNFSVNMSGLLEYTKTCRYDPKLALFSVGALDKCSWKTNPSVHRFKPSSLYILHTHTNFIHKCVKTHFSAHWATLCLACPILSVFLFSLLLPCAFPKTSFPVVWVRVYTLLIYTMSMIRLVVLEMAALSDQTIKVA